MPLSLVLWSIAAALCFLTIARLVSRPAKIREARRRVHGLLLEMWLYGDEPVQVLRTQIALIRANLRYLLLLAPAVIASAAPILLIWMHLDNQFGHRPLRAGETAIMTAQLRSSGIPNGEVPTVEAPDGFRFETPPVRVVADSLVVWRLRAIADTESKPRVSDAYAWAEIAYPPRSISLFGIAWPWEAWFLLFSTAVALAFHGRFGVTF